MTDLYEGVELNAEETTLICRGLLDLAAVDGVHENEVALIKQFYSTSGGTLDDLAALRSEPFDLATVRDVIKGPVIDAFLTSCYLLIYADGHHSDAERTRIGEYAAALDITPDQLEDLHLKARRFLLQELAAGLRNQGVLAQVGADLGLDDGAVAHAISKEN